MMDLKDRYLDRIADALEQQMGVSPKLIGGNVLKPNIYRIADALDPNPQLLAYGTVNNPLARIADAIESGKLKSESDIPVFSADEFRAMSYEDFIQYEKFLVSDDTSGFMQGTLYDGTKATPFIDLVETCVVNGVINTDYSLDGNKMNVIVKEDKVEFKPQGIGSGILQFHKQVRLKDKITLDYEFIQEGALADFGIQIGTTIGGSDLLQKHLISGSAYSSTIIREVDIPSLMDTYAYISIYNSVGSYNKGWLYLTSLVV